MALRRSAFCKRTAGADVGQTAAYRRVWLCYSTSFVATNLYITDFMTRVKGLTGSQASLILLVCGGIGFFFYVLGGLIGERWGRREVLIGTGLLVAPLNFIFLFVNQYALIAIVYVLIYQVTNGAWSGAGYAYQAESFPTRVRGTAVIPIQCTNGIIWPCQR
jgi:predicted MFS family arabinose efflux permease